MSGSTWTGGDIIVSSTVTLTELFVVLVTFGGLIAAIINGVEARVEHRRIVRSGHNGSKRRTTRWLVREEVLRVLGLLVFFGLGVLLTTQPQSTPTLQGFVIKWLLIFVAAGLSYGSLAARYDRARLKDDWEHEEAERLKAEAKWDGTTERRKSPDLCPHCEQPLPYDKELDARRHHQLHIEEDMDNANATT